MGETKRHLEARTALYLLLKDAFKGDALGSDQYVYFDAANPQRCLSPDVFVKRGCTENNFDVWKVWKSGAPDLAIEIISAHDRRDDNWDDKMARYHASGISEVVRFDPAAKDNPIRVWDRVEEDLVERDPESDTLRECTTLGLWWAVVPSEYGPQLRLARDSEGTDLLPTPGEERVRLVQELEEERKARALAEHQKLLAEHEAKQAEQTRAKEAEARQREAEARTEAERQRDAALRELAKLRAELANKKG